jgi:hypothetical protein
MKTVNNRDVFPSSAWPYDGRYVIRERSKSILKPKNLFLEKKAFTLKKKFFFYKSTLLSRFLKPIYKAIICLQVAWCIISQMLSKFMHLHAEVHSRHFQWICLFANVSCQKNISEWLLTEDPPKLLEKCNFGGNITMPVLKA